MFNFVIGCSVNDTEMVEQFKQELGEFSSPKTIVISNVMPTSVVDVSNGVIELDGNLKPEGKTTGEFTFHTLSQLVAFSTNMLAISKLNGFERAILLSEAESHIEDSAPPQDKEESKGTEQADEKMEDSAKTKKAKKNAEKVADATETKNDDLDNNAESENKEV